MTKMNGYQAMITQHAWMFLSSFEKLRTKLLATDIVNMAHLGARAFEEIGGEVVQTTAFVMRKSHIAAYNGLYCRLLEPTTQQGKEDMFLAGKKRYAADQANFSKIPGSPIAYWVSEKLFYAFASAPKMGNIANVKVGLQTGNNNLFLKIWHEVSYGDISFGTDGTSKVKFVPHNKAGDYRKWYGNGAYVVNWENNGAKIKAFSGAYLRNTAFYFKEGFSWTDVSAGAFSCRYWPKGCIFDTCAPTLFTQNTNLFLLGLVNSKVGQCIMDIMSPTIHYTAGSMMNFPVWRSKKEVDVYIVENTKLSKMCIRDRPSSAQNAEFLNRAKFPLAAPAAEVVK